MLPDFTPEFIARFWSHVKTGDPDECWEWQKGKCGKGYGETFFKQPLKSHRVAYMLAKGEIPNGKFVCHSCDNPPCCNPAHLWIGTNAENQQDASRKGRSAYNWKPPRGDDHYMRRCPEWVKRGEKHPRAKLTEEIVREARRRYAAGIPFYPLAKEAGVAEQVLSNAVHRRTWKSVK